MATIRVGLPRLAIHLTRSFASQELSKIGRNIKSTTVLTKRKIKSYIGFISIHCTNIDALS
ncbi:hypothetical protein GQ43DRAFT_444146 [Delitschia confertaspora ATCC 74209]|uniref:Uncharacterized protein n=1 Tax=Delitschia confertaspora ATCC 74209 TaxID=1513339 RepID=A0A9P4JHZ2_9PLEO|nr:hypothetical protein GQ43DRAFT_444146 [Delitschia confertaspora ATCC 74209]